MSRKERVIKPPQIVPPKRAPWGLAAAVLVLVGSIAVWKSSSTHLPNASPIVAASTPTPPPSTKSFTLTIPNAAPAPDNAPDGMAWIPGGEFSMGAQDPPGHGRRRHAGHQRLPAHSSRLRGRFLDGQDRRHERRSSQSSSGPGYVTVAERKPRAEDFPGAPPENLVAGSVVFSPPDHAVPLNDHFQWWHM